MNRQLMEVKTFRYKFIQGIKKKSKNRMKIDDTSFTVSFHFLILELFTVYFNTCFWTPFYAYDIYNALCIRTAKSLF